MLEPYEGKPSRTVLRRESGSNPADLAGKTDSTTGKGIYGVSFRALCSLTICVEMRNKTRQIL